jgi:hypothetical protein
MVDPRDAEESVDVIIQQFTELRQQTEMNSENLKSANEEIAVLKEMISRLVRNETPVGGVGAGAGAGAGVGGGGGLVMERSLVSSELIE